MSKITDVYGTDITKIVVGREKLRRLRKIRNLRRYENRYYRIAAERVRKARIHWTAVKIPLPVLFGNPPTELVGVPA